MGTVRQRVAASSRRSVIECMARKILKAGQYDRRAFRPLYSQCQCQTNQLPAFRFPLSAFLPHAQSPQLPLPPNVPANALHPATIIAFTEGPAVAADGTLYFADIINNRILKLAPDGTRSVFREPSHRTNGQTFDREGRLWHCEGSEFGPGGGRRVTRTDLRTGEYTVITDRYGRRALQLAQRYLLRPPGPDVFHRSLLWRSLNHGDRRSKGCTASIPTAR